MMFLHKIRKIKNITKMATGRVALRYANNNQFLLASVILNTEYIFKLLSSLAILYFIFFTDIRPKDAPDWIVIVDVLFTLVLCVVVFYTRRERLIWRAEIITIKRSKMKNSYSDDNNISPSND
ncbi:TPA: hypothetical protein ACNUUK_001590 [Aeromonas salmonicida subsp. smithia]|uniref:hypothetical protein n=1 Tax=Aeromonas salmonicida TaxID=645 RepID=UPI000C1C4FD3|nr:hypothetical protein [Aeromonas salmonicida]ATU98168.1 hypothetical protein CHQ57_12460 [Aeromonas salmonicida]